MLTGRGTVQLEKQSYDQATTALNQALGQLQRAGDYMQEAIVYNGRALINAALVISRNPKNAEAYYKLGLLLELQGQDDKAQKSYEEARSLGRRA